MSAKIKRFQPKDKLVKQQDLLKLQSALELFPELNEKKVASLMWEAKKQAHLHEETKEGKPFIMMFSEQNTLVVRWLTANSKRPLKALELWAVLFEYVNYETGQIMLSRQELADKLEIHLNHISNIMSELESINAITKEKEGRGVTYYLNPNVGTHLPQPHRKEAQSQAPKLALINGGKE
ncbi:unnamed protein product [Commensalibacter communis]|uniref:hypothetical protein n=1 Tax=Commensalibacter communis TaxID=2972786 RepID=UPI0022FF5785|nr:hypothetical protein [Commensalibacter communis]CAI3960809.1 unnamed protein product [Commensalibacter communis]